MAICLSSLGVIAAGVLSGLGIVNSGVLAQETGSETVSSSSETSESSLSTASGVVASLEEKDGAPQTGFDRDRFGWRDDVDGNGCDTRNDVLRRDLTAITVKDGTKGCVVSSGTLRSVYSGKNVMLRSETDTTVDIDHVVTLSDAWQSGAASWNDARLVQFANDPLNLIAVESSLTKQKAGGDAAAWLPPRVAYRCEYVARQAAVKAKYRLWVKPAERVAMNQVLESCPGQPAFTSPVDWPAVGSGDIVESSTPSPTKSASPSPTQTANRTSPTAVTTTPTSPASSNPPDSAAQPPQPTPRAFPPWPQGEAPVETPVESNTVPSLVVAGQYCMTEGDQGVTFRGNRAECQMYSDGQPRWRVV